MSKAKVATVWLDGCSGCHMSLLDMDQRLIDLAGKIELVYSPLVDNKVYPDQVDVAIVEGAVASDEDAEKVHKIRKHTKIVLALGDCAITGNVPSMRNGFGLDALYDRAFRENVTEQAQKPAKHLPVLLDKVRPVHELVTVDVFVPGCPPPADAIHYALVELLEGRIPDTSALTRFGK
jgi:NAD-reducing hydrogenase small subunit